MKNKGNQMNLQEVTEQALQRLPFIILNWE